MTTEEKLQIAMEALEHFAVLEMIEATLIDCYVARETLKEIQEGFTTRIKQAFTSTFLQEFEGSPTANGNTKGKTLIGDF